MFMVMALSARSAGAQGTQAGTSLPPPQPDVQLVMPGGEGQGAAPITLTLKDALDRAQKLDPGYLGAVTDAKLALEDRLQARNALLPQFTGTSQYLNTQGNGVTPDGRFVTNDGIHVYRDWLVFRQDLSPATLMGTGLKRADAARALAQAKLEIARRGLTVAVNKAYYALVIAQRKYGSTQQTVEQTARFLQNTQNLERLGQSPHSDVIKAQIQFQQAQGAFDETALAMATARIDLAVMLFPALNENFTVVDDLDNAAPLPPFPEVQTMASRENPDVRAALETVHLSELDLKVARNAFLPVLTTEVDYGIEANQFALHGVQAAFPEAGVLPNLGYYWTVSLTVPVWDWGTLRSKVRQATLRQDTARVQLTQKQRQLMGEIYAAYNEAAVARSAVDKLRSTADLAAESLRLTALRYQGGLATALEVADAQNTLTAARNAYNDAQVRYRTALAALQTFTGSF